MKIYRALFALIFCALTTAGLQAKPTAQVTPVDLRIPRYDHVFLIVEENHGYDVILHDGFAPNLTRLADAYGSATQFFATRHPSEPNYVALFAGSTFGIADDASFTTNSVDASNLATQLEAQGLTWGGYFGGYDPATPLATRTPGKYASKHNPFVNFSNLRSQPGFAAHQHTLETLAVDLANSAVPNFALIVPGLCSDMHGAAGCDADPGKTQAGDRAANAIVEQITDSPLWRSSKNEAIVITWDENDDAHRSSGQQGCCGTLPGGGQIPTIVITNHGPRRAKDSTPYNHYSLLRSLEDAFGIHQYLGEAANWSSGVRPMSELFEVQH